MPDPDPIAVPAPPPLAVLIMGPTATGKSALALALAQRLPAEIVSVDSAQVYRGLDIGTAKPDAATRARVAHHLIDILDPTESYSAARFVDDALAAVAAIAARGRVPLLAGGTMLYFKALREGLSDLPRADPAVRARILERARERGWSALHAELARADPATAARIAPADRQRIQRALEVLEVTGRPMSALLAGTGPRPPRIDLLPLALVPPERSWLHRRIAERFAAMLAAGLVEEVRALRAAWPLAADMPSMRCVGYRQAWQCLEGEIAPDELLARGIHATRQLAKRQLTWLRRTPAEALDCTRADLERVARARIERALAARA